MSDPNEAFDFDDNGEDGDAVPMVAVKIERPDEGPSSAADSSTGAGRRAGGRSLCVVCMAKPCKGKDVACGDCTKDVAGCKKMQRLTTTWSSSSPRRGMMFRFDA
jgi:hypothetical protein